MFNQEELKFIKETAERDLDAVNMRHDHMVNEIARLGKSLSDLKVVQSKLLSIAKAIQDDEEEQKQPKPYSRCC